MVEQRSRRWQLTENNNEYTMEEALDHLQGIGVVRYAIACSEIGESGTKHIHVFVVYQNAIRLATIKSVFARAHLELCEGTNEDNINYLKKQGNYIERGHLPTPSISKKDVASAVVRLLLSGEKLHDIMRDNPDLCDYIVRNYRSLKDIEQNAR